MCRIIEKSTDFIPHSIKICETKLDIIMKQATMESKHNSKLRSFLKPFGNLYS